MEVKNQELALNNLRINSDLDAIRQTLNSTQEQLAIQKSKCDVANRQIQDMKIDSLISARAATEEMNGFKSDNQRLKSELEMLRAEGPKYANRELVERVGQLERDNAKLEASLVTETKSKDQMITILNQFKPSPANKGTLGELEIHEYLQSVLGNLMSVKDVSKIGQGHKMDLELVSRDGKVRIRIDVKNATRVPDDQIARFYKDIDSSEIPLNGAILFMNCPLRAMAGTTENFENGANIIRTRRGNTSVHQVGRWCKEDLVESIHFIIIDYLKHLDSTPESMQRFSGCNEVACAIEAVTAQMLQMAKKLASFADLGNDWKKVGREQLRFVADKLRRASAANPIVVPITIASDVEKEVPKGERGGVVKLDSHGMPAAKAPKAAKRKAPSQIKEEKTSPSLSDLTQSLDSLTKPYKRPRK
jgi:hypothetical protein